jgi:L-alanine-DL-glutamate epimerase-like enolase superfamily enzyme
MSIDRVEVYDLKLKLRRPYRISFKTTFHTDNLLVAIRSKEGQVGYGEAAPSKPITGDAKPEAVQFSLKASTELQGKNACDIAAIHNLLEKISQETSMNSQSAKAAIDEACYDLLGKLEKKPVYEILGETRPRIVPVSIGHGIESPEDLVRYTQEYLEKYDDKGPWSIKLKLDGDSKMDVRRVLAVAEVFLRGIKLDPNQVYTDAEVAAETFNTLYDNLGSRIILIEQPCPRGELSKMKYIAEHTEIPIYADESAATLEDVKRVIKEEAADGVNLKLPKIGGIYWAAQAAKLLKDAGLKVQVGSMNESRVGLAAASSLAAGTTNVLETDLDPDIYFEADITTDDSLLFRWGARVPSGRPGLGVRLKGDFNSIVESNVSIQKLTG